MKIRRGFVSNSSSSSFICIGIKVRKSNIGDLDCEYIDNEGYTLLDHSENGYGDPDYCIIGHAYNLDDFPDTDETDIDEIIKICETIRLKTGKEGKSVVITGTRMS